jgi:murein DD-endopeptidase MepM/ murein hydrolase activator NlpD
VSDEEIIFLVGVILMLSKQDDIDWGGGWVWPVPTEAPSTPAVISQEFRRPSHLGVDILYRTAAGFTAPGGTPVLAARDAVVWSVGQTARGWNIVLDHGPPFATFYQHLEAQPRRSGSGAVLAKGDRVSAGEQVGIMGVDPTDPQRVRHLHFAVWYKGNGDASSVDPAPAMASWRRVLWTP